MAIATAPQLTLPKPKMALYNGKKAKPDLMAKSLRALATVLKVGESEARALEITGQQFRKYDIGKAYTRAAKTMRTQGATFKQALLVEDVFPRTVRELVGAANTSSGIHKNLNRAAKLIAQGQNVKKKVLVSLIQPAFMFGLCLVFMFVSAAVIIPGMIASFATLSAETPPLTLVVLQVAEVTKYVLGVVFGLVVLYAGFWFAYGKRSPAVRVLSDTIGLRIPVLGNILQHASTSRLFELLTTNLETGMGEAQALESAGAGAGNEAIRAHCLKHAEKMRTQGAKLSEFTHTRLFPENAQYMLAAAPSVKQQIDIMNELAPEYRDEADIQLEAFSKTIEPLVNYFVYAVAGVLIISVIVPMYGIFPALMNMSDTSGGGASTDPTGGLIG